MSQDIPSMLEDSPEKSPVAVAFQIEDFLPIYHTHDPKVKAADEIMRHKKDVN